MTDDRGSFQITFTLDRRRAAEFLGRLAFDDEFRALLESGEGEDALSEYGISFEGGGPLIGPGTEDEIVLPKKKHIQDVIRAIQFPKGDPPQGLSWCKVWAAAAAAAASGDDEE
jgi:hypothetical protein